MSIPRSERADLLRARAEAAGQGHVFAYFEQLDDAERERLLEQVEALDFELVRALAESLSRDAEPELSAFAPPELFPLEREAEHDRRAREARAAGEELLAGGEVGFLLVAGGQASRLGYEGPKGAFPVGPVSGRTLFEFHARRLLAAGARYGTRTPWYVMTSEANDAATRELFAASGCFGLPAEDVVFFLQDMLPALDDEGRILLASRGEIFLAPGGHGGVLPAMLHSGALADARARGLRTLSYFQVDNPLARPADPLFLGLHALEGAEMSSKVVEKSDPGEKVGVIGRIDGRLGCIEYSDLPDELRHARDAHGRLLFRAGNIALHAIELSFVEKLTRGGLRLPWHRAPKSMRVLDETGRPSEREGLKFETFVFDALGLAAGSVTLEVERAFEFSPVKNAEGSDSPETARRDLCRLHASWVRAAGLSLPEPDESGHPPVEVDPLLAEDSETFAARAPVKPEVHPSGHLYVP